MGNVYGPEHNDNMMTTHISAHDMCMKLEVLSFNLCERSNMHEFVLSATLSSDIEHHVLYAL